MATCKILIISSVWCQFGLTCKIREAYSVWLLVEGKKRHFFMLRLHADASLFASWGIIRLWTVKSKSCLTIFLSISHFAVPDCLTDSVIHLPQRDLPLFFVSPSLSCRPLFLCCSKHICPSFISLWSDSDNAESVFMTQYGLTVCLCGIAPHTHLLSSSPFFVWFVSTLLTS